MLSIESIDHRNYFRFLKILRMLCGIVDAHLDDNSYYFKFEIDKSL